MGASKNSFVVRIASSRGAHNPHVHKTYIPVVALRAPSTASPKINF